MGSGASKKVRKAKYAKQNKIQQSNDTKATSQFSKIENTAKESEKSMGDIVK